MEDTHTHTHKQWIISNQEFPCVLWHPYFIYTENDKNVGSIFKQRCVISLYQSVYTSFPIPPI